MGVRRLPVQLGATILFNSVFLVPWAKSVPCIGFNCYACPAAITACPIGSLQHFGVIRRVPYYLLGFLGLVGILIGRLACGWFCPFGMLQDLMYKIPLPKWKMSNRLARFRYVIFVALVVIAPIVTYEPWFCKLCPAGALEAGLPLVIFDTQIRALAGLLFAIKMVILVGFSALVHRDHTPLLPLRVPAGKRIRPVQLGKWRPSEFRCRTLHPLRRMRIGLPHGVVSA